MGFLWWHMKRAMANEAGNFIPIGLGTAKNWQDNRAGALNVGAITGLQCELSVVLWQCSRVFLPLLLFACGTVAVPKYLSSSSDRACVDGWRIGLREERGAGYEHTNEA